MFVYQRVTNQEASVEAPFLLYSTSLPSFDTAQKRLRHRFLSACRFVLWQLAFFSVRWEDWGDWKN